MLKRPFGKTGLDVSPLGFGGSEIGFRGTDQATVDAALHAALDAGLDVIDTAECYRDSEEKIGRALHGRRDEFHLFTKCGHRGDELGGADWEPAVLARSIDRSLERLKTDRIDLVQLHSCPLEMLQKGDVIEVLEKAKEAGKMRLIGYSGDNEALRYAVECGRFDAIQTSVNVADQVNIPTVALAAERGLGVIAKRPIANAAWTWEPPVGDYAHDYHERLEGLAYDELDAGLALRFTLAVPGVSTAIVGTSRPGRWAENAALIDTPLPEGRYEQIRARFAEVGTDWPGLG